MLTLALAAVSFNVVCLAGVYLFARNSSVLVDEHGHTLARNNAWQERLVPAARQENKVHH
jgi:hypothetical protein